MEPTTLHVGFDDHVSGFLLTPEHIADIYALHDSEHIVDYIISHCERTECNEAELFFDAYDGDLSEFKTELEFFVD